MRILTCLIVAALTIGAGRAWAIGEVITDVRVRDNVRTQEETIRKLAGVDIGDLLETNTLEIVRERLHSTGLFADVNVYWEPFREGVRINIVIKDKFPWAPVPTFSYAPGNVSAGLVVAHGNLFGRGKRGLIGGRISTADSGALLAYQDPAFLGSWAFWQMRGQFQQRILPEYGNVQTSSPKALRETTLRQAGVGASFGVAWWRRVKTSVGWSIETVRVLESGTNADNPEAPPGLPWAAIGGERGVAEAQLSFDFRAREHAILYGNALTFTFNHGSPRWGSDERFTYWKAGTEYEHGVRILRSMNLVLRTVGVTGHHLPFWAENSLGGSNLRGYMHRQFTGDTQISGQAEFHFPLFSVSKVQVRGLLFSDGAAIWFRRLPAITPGNTYALRRDEREFLPPPYLVEGFDPDRDIHSSAGAGLRFFIKSIAVPLVGVDVGRAMERGAPIRVIIVAGG